MQSSCNSSFLNAAQSRPERPLRRPRPPRSASLQTLHRPRRLRRLRLLEIEIIAAGIDHRTNLRHLRPLPPAPLTLRRRHRRDGPRGQRAHLRRRQRPPQHAPWQSEVDLPELEALPWEERRGGLVEEQRVGVAEEGGCGRFAAAGVEVEEGVSGGDGDRVLPEVAAGGDDLRRRKFGDGGGLHRQAQTHGKEKDGSGRVVAGFSGARGDYI